MSLETKERAELVDVLEALRGEVARLGERVSALESRVIAASVPLPATPPVPSRPKSEPLSEELVIVIAAAVAAYLGKKPHIRQIRLLGSAAWAQQGRVTIQASHTLRSGSGRS